MSYKATAIIKRPQRFADLIGQEFVAETLRNSVQNGKIAHAYIFSGPRGCGKTSSARILAKAVNCTNLQDGEPCGVCESCKQITAGISTDVFEIDGASNTGVNDVRQIRDDVLFPPVLCKYKIFIIDEVHMLSQSAFNALLKTIEEPPSYVIFIFATTEIQKVPATIKSRCQHFNYRLVSPERICDLLTNVATEQQISFENEALLKIAVQATGSIRDAYTLYDQAVSYTAGNLTAEKVQSMLGLVDISTMNEIFEFCVDGENLPVLQKFDDFLQSGVSVEQFTVNCIDYLRGLLLVRSGVTNASVIGENHERISQKVLSGWDVSRIERALSLFLHLFRDLRFSASPRYEAEAAIIRLCSLSKSVTAEEILADLTKLRHIVGSGNFTATDVSKKKIDSVTKISPPVTEGTSCAPLEPENLDAIQKELIAVLHREGSMAAMLLEKSTQWTFDGEKYDFFVNSEFEKHQVETTKPQILNALFKITKKHLTFTVNSATIDVADNPPGEALPVEIEILKKLFNATEVKNDN